MQGRQFQIPKETKTIWTRKEKSKLICLRKAIVPGENQDTISKIKYIYKIKMSLQELLLI